MTNTKKLAQLLQGHKVCSFGIATRRLQKKREKLFWECIFALLNLKRKINIERKETYYFSHIGNSTTMEIKLNWLPMTLFLICMMTRV